MLPLQILARSGHSPALSSVFAALSSPAAALRMVLTEYGRSLTAAQRYEALRVRGRNRAGAAVFAEFYAAGREALPPIRAACDGRSRPGRHWGSMLLEDFVIRITEAGRRLRYVFPHVNRRDRFEERQRDPRTASHATGVNRGVSEGTGIHSLGTNVRDIASCALAASARLACRDHLLQRR